jgi:hypothetical protein
MVLISGYKVLHDAIPSWVVPVLARIAEGLYADDDLHMHDDHFDLHRTRSEWGGLMLERVLQLLLVRGRIEEAALLQEIAARVGGAGYQALYRFSFFRRLTPDRPAGAPWHCDAEAASTAQAPGGAENCVTAWIPFESVGLALPSLEVLAESNAIMRKEELMPGTHRTDEWVDALPGERLVPALDPGDMLAFDQFTLHRTQQIPVTAPRTTLELRFTSR